MSSNNIDTQLNNIFDEDNAPPEFDVVLRGFDRNQVQDYLDGLRNEVKEANSAAEKYKAELNSKQRQLQERERPTYSGLGSRIEELLRLAEEQANELVQGAQIDANDIRSAAKIEAAEMRAAAESEATEVRTLAQRERVWSASAPRCV